eukprot:TRINITY_DN29880_c0_g1_i1.p1 TRINITY_DN29880_c0_g1~~TRINITY_DN29880_c0_g1_i1.p1  ORF type:complete len:220 (-),score=32.73 TRINITY_DN29880_c0_g1_i1:48-707(-)
MQCKRSGSNISTRSRGEIAAAVDCNMELVQATDESPKRNRSRARSEVSLWSDGEFALESSVTSSPRASMPMTEGSRTVEIELCRNSCSEELGVSITYVSDTCLKIATVKESGKVPTWNADNPHQIVRAGDYIWAVNGIHCDSHEMLQELAGARNLVITISNVPVEDAKKPLIWASVSSILEVEPALTPLDFAQEMDTGPVKCSNLGCRPCFMTNGSKVH